MEIKKSFKADLESKKVLFMEIGIVAALALMLIAFEWASTPTDNTLMQAAQMGELDEEIIPITRQQPEQPPPPPPPPQVIEVINIVEDNVDIEEFDFDDMEADEDMSIDFVPFEEEEEADEEVFFIVEDMPMFQGGGKEKFRGYIAECMFN